MKLEENLWGLNEKKHKKYNIAYNTCSDKNICNSKEYHVWSYMLRLAYEDNQKFTNRRKDKKISVCEEWLDFANFNEWYNENYYSVENEYMDLCRNLLNQDNEEFCPDECVFAPRRLLQLITPKRTAQNGLPRGVGYRNTTDTYYSTCYITKNGKPTTIRHSGFKTADEAFQQYKKDKEDYIKAVAKEYMNKVPRSVYRALMKYEVRP